MATLPLTGYLSSAQRTEGEMKQALEDMRDALAELAGDISSFTLEITAGILIPTGPVHLVDTEAQAATDDLSQIDLTGTVDGRLLYINAASAARVVTVKHNAGGAGQISLVGGQDFILDSTEKWLLLVKAGTLWREIIRSYGTDQAGARSNLGLGTAATANVGSGNSLDADLLDGQEGSFYQNASNLNVGTIPEARFASDSNGDGVRTVSTAAPSGGADGDVWYQY